MNINLISPISNEAFEVAWVEIHTSVGNFIIQDGHAPMVLTLRAQEPITLGLPEGKERYFLLKNGGIIHINRKDVTVFVTTIS